jgi:hypothetical protein
MKVPRKYLGTEGNTLLDNLALKASTKGIPVKLGETVSLSIKMEGSFTNPTIKTELKEVAGDAMKEMKQQAVDFAKAKVDTVKQTVKDTLRSVKNQVVTDLKGELKEKVFGAKDSADANNIDTTKKRTEQTIKNTLKNLLNKKKRSASDSTKKN